jgi:hypothetical protein
VSSADYFTPAAIAELVLPSPLYQVVSVQQTQEVNGNDLLDYADIAFTVTGRPGVFTFQYPLRGLRALTEPVDLTSEAGIINAIYGIAV